MHGLTLSCYLACWDPDGCSELCVDSRVLFEVWGVSVLFGGYSSDLVGWGVMDVRRKAIFNKGPSS